MKNHTLPVLAIIVGCHLLGCAYEKPRMDAEMEPQKLPEFHPHITIPRSLVPNAKMVQLAFGDSKKTFQLNPTAVGDWTLILTDEVLNKILGETSGGLLSASIISKTVNEKGRIEYAYKQVDIFIQRPNHSLAVLTTILPH